MDFFKATADDLKALKWGRWSKDSPLWLCPEKQFADLPDGIALHSISGEVAVKGRDFIDDDTRYGLLAYGIIPGRTSTGATAAEVATRQAARAAEFAEEMAAIARQTGVYVLAPDGIRKLEGGDAEASVRALSAPVPRA